jgi:tRNA U54 and U55 pseudouridine synthase Pus10
MKTKIVKLFTKELTTCQDCPSCATNLNTHISRCHETPRGRKIRGLTIIYKGELYYKPNNIPKWCPLKDRYENKSNDNVDELAELHDIIMTSHDNCNTDDGLVCPDLQDDMNECSNCLAKKIQNAGFTKLSTGKNYE